MTVEKHLIENPPSLDWVTFIGGVRHETKTYEEACELTKNKRFYAYWNCKDRKRPVFSGGAA